MLPTTICERCGRCCQGIGDMYLGSPEDGDCPWLVFESKLAVCTVERDCGREEKPWVCRAYPFPDIDNGKCQRQLNEVLR